MDDPAADESLLLATVEQFGAINRLVSRSRTLISRYILDDAARRGIVEYTVLDLGAGGCDIAEWLVEAAERRGQRPHVICLDSDPRIAAYARRRVAGNDSLEVVEAAAEDLSRLGPVDYIFANHFVHHLDDDEIVGLLPAVSSAARYAFVLNDLKRSRLSLAGFTVLAALFFRKSFALTDGRISIRRGFRRDELEALIRRAGLGAAARAAPGTETARGTLAAGATDVRVRSLFPGRLAVVGQSIGGAQPHER
jgi:2-polyprenyl-3-methyl-5-hydroxy-6-metoxy-1,4-benzoquinol methylase